MALSVAHRTPADAIGIAALAAAGATVFEVDVRLLGGHLRVTHFQPLLRGVPLVQHDNWRLRLGPPRAPHLSDVLALVPEGCEDIKVERIYLRVEVEIAQQGSAPGDGVILRIRKNAP